MGSAYGDINAAQVDARDQRGGSGDLSGGCTARAPAKAAEKSLAARVYGAGVVTFALPEGRITALPLSASSDFSRCGDGGKINPKETQPSLLSTA